MRLQKEKQVETTNKNSNKTCEKRLSKLWTQFFPIFNWAIFERQEFGLWLLIIEAMKKIKRAGTKKNFLFFKNKHFQSYESH